MSILGVPVGRSRNYIPKFSSVQSSTRLKLNRLELRSVESNGSAELNGSFRLNSDVKLNRFGLTLRFHCNKLL